MAERRWGKLEALDESARPELVAQYTAVIRRLLEHQFPATAGYEHNGDWRLASCVKPKQHSLDIQRACRALSVKITQGRHWGIAVTTTPADIKFKSFKVIVGGAVPFVESVREWIIAVAAGISAVLAVVGTGIEIWNHPGLPNTALKGGLIAFGAAFIVLSFIGLLLLSPLRAILSTVRMKESVAAGIHASEQAWAELQSSVPKLPSLMPKRSPAFVYACCLAVLLPVAALCFLLTNWSNLPLTATVVLAVLLSILGFAAFGMLVGVVGALLGVIDE